MIRSEHRQEPLGKLLHALEQQGVALWLDGERLRFRAPRGVMDETRRAQLRAHKQAIIAHLRDEQRDEAQLSGDPASRFEPFALTELQQAYLFGRSAAVDLGGIGSHVYLEAQVDELDVDRAEQAWRRLVAHHDMLRAVVLDDGRQQVLAEVPPLSIATVDLSALAPEQAEQSLQQLREQLSHRIYDPARWPLFDVCITTLPGGRTHMHLSFELLIVDVWSIFLLLEQYRRLLDDPAAELPQPGLTFRDYVGAFDAHRRSDAYQRAWAYWQARSAELPPGPELPRRPNPPAEPRVRRHAGKLPSPAWTRLKARAHRAGLTPNALLIAVFSEVLASWAKSPRFTLSLPLFQRLPVHADVMQLVGDFTSVVLLAVDGSGGGAFLSRAQKLHRQLLDDLEHSAVNGVEVLRERMRQHGASPQALFPVVFTSTLGMHAWSELRRIWGDLVAGVSQTPQVCLDHQIYESEEGLLISWDVWEELFPEGVIEAMFAANLTALERLSDEADEALAAWQSPTLVPLPEPQRRLRARVNATEQRFEDVHLHTLLERRIAETPSAPAVITPSETLTFAELGRRANAVAASITCRPSELVACVMGKSQHQISAVLGTLRAGGAYLPIDAALPPQRIAELLADAGVTSALTLQAHATDGWTEGIETIAVDALEPADTPAPPALTSRREELAYVIYTSGSTGKPKGVMIAHRAAANTIQDINARFGVGPIDRVLGLSSMSFDLSVYDVFGVLGAGGALVLPDPARAREPRHWIELVQQHGVSLWNTVPQLAALLIDEAEREHGEAAALETLRVALLSGDWIPVPLPERFSARAPGLEVVSLGGATEASIWSIAYPITQIDPSWASIPYGTPLANQQLYVLDEQLRPRPDRSVGEIYIGGVGLALGYWGDPDKTAHHFVQDPHTGRRLYRTGDLGRHLPDGNIELLGREDGQVKIRGFRVEVGEIEAALMRHEEVDQAVVVAYGKPPADRTLVAYVTPAGCQPDMLRSWLGTRLPDYMVPAIISTLDALPLSANGKVDRRRLPRPLAASNRAALHETGRVAEITRWLASRIAQRFDASADAIDPRCSLVQLGVDSITALRLARDLEAELGLRVEMAKLWQSPSLLALAETLAELGAETAAAPAAAITADPDNAHQLFPLTDLQRAYWLGRSEHLELGGVSCHIYVELEREGLDVARLERAFNVLVQRHSMLRAVVTADGQQRVLPNVDNVNIAVADLRGAQDVQAEIEKIREALSHQRFDTTQWPLFELRASLLDGGRVRLHVSFDLLVADVLSFLIMLEELRVIDHHPEVSLPPQQISFRDYVMAEERARSTPAYQRSLDYWRERIRALPPPPELPLAKSPATVGTPRFRRRQTVLDAAAWRTFREHAGEHGVTPAMALAAAYSAVLARWSKEARFTLNLTLFNRLAHHPDVERMIGDFTSVTLLEVDARGTPALTDLSQRLQQQLWQDLDHREIGGVRALGEWSRHLGAPAMAPVVFTCALGAGDRGAAADAEDTAADWLGEVVYAVSQTPQVWLDHQAVELSGKLLVSWDALEELFPEELLDDMFGAYTALLQELAAGQRWTVPSPCPVPAEQLQVRARANETAAPLPEGLLHRALSSRADDRSAAIIAGETIDYRSYAASAQRIACSLRAAGVQRGDRVAVVAEKGAAQINSCLGVLAAGGCYVPLSPSLPVERLRYVIETTGAKVVLTERARPNIDDESMGAQVLASGDVPAGETSSSLGPAEPDDLAYIIFTSGSTGRPKGVMIEHRAALNTCVDINRRFGVGAADRIFGLSALDFDLSVYDIFGALDAGGALVLPDADKLRDPGHWLDRMHEAGVTIYNSAPALMGMLVEYLRGSERALPPSLRLVLLSGDWIPLDVVRELKQRRPDIEVVSLGGATEASIWSIIYPIEQLDPEWRSVPYGRPLSNQRWRVLDADMQPRPVWGVGELCIAGDGLARGYWGDEQLTAARFVRHPLSGERLYRTGDLGRYLPGGIIEILGREDFQVKIRGHRIELGEIESVLAEADGVRQAVVWPQPGPGGQRRLVAYILGEASHDALHELLSRLLPEYMLPAAYVTLDALPVTSNGKLDRKALPLPERAAAEPGQAPRSELEERIAGVWRRVLGIDDFGVEQSFFDIGGYSQLAVRLVMELGRELGVDVPVWTLFETQTVAGLAARLAGTGGGEQRPTQDEDLYAHYARRALGWRLKALGTDKHYVAGQGTTLSYEASGQRVEVLDLVGGYGSTLLGHNHPELVQLSRDMLDRSVPSHAQHGNPHAAGKLARALSDRLEEATGSPFTITFGNSGAEAVEAAIKHAKMEYQARARATERVFAASAGLLLDQIDRGAMTVAPSLLAQVGEALGGVHGEAPASLREAYRRFAAHNAAVWSAEPLFLGLEHAFHGMTSGALSLTASEDFRAPVRWMGVRARLIAQCADGLERAVTEERATLLSLRMGQHGVEIVRQPWVQVCAFFIEPIQGEGGIHPVDGDFAATLRQVADRDGFPIVVDEIQAGMGRTGRFTSAESIGLAGDYYTFSKSLGGGLVKVAAMAVRANRYQEELGVVHGSTYAEDTPGCTIALSALEIITRDGVMEACRDKGERFMEKLRTLQRRYPDIIVAVRGAGLMIGVEINAPSDSPSLMLRTLSESDPAMFNQLIAGYLLNVERIRVAPTKTRRAIRLLPAVQISDQEMDRLCSALARVCEMIEKLNVGRLIRYMVDDSGDPAEPIRDWRADYPEVVDEAPLPGEPQVAHIGHIEDSQSMLLVEPSLAELPEQERDGLLWRFVRVAKPAIGQRLRVKSAQGGTVHVTIIGLLLTSAIFEQLMGGNDRALILDAIDDAIELARDLGCTLIGLGGYTSIATLNCTAVAHPERALTSGNAYTAALGIDAALEYARDKGIDPTQVRIAIVGAKGNIGSICARILAEHAAEMLLVGRRADDPKLVEVADAIYGDVAAQLSNGHAAQARGVAATVAARLNGSRPDADATLRDVLGERGPIRISDDLADLAECDVVLSCTSAPTAIIGPEHLGGRVQVVCDIATPRDVHAQAWQAHPHIAFVDGGIAKLPDDRGLQLFATQLPRDHLFGCVAETALLGLAGWQRNHSFGAISSAEVERMRALGKEHGMTFGRAGIRSRKPVDAELSGRTSAGRRSR